MSPASIWRAISPIRRSPGGRFHPPPCGEGRRAKRAGGGVARLLLQPPPRPLPTRGRGKDTAPSHPVRIRPRRHRHRGNDLRRAPREPRPREAARARRSAAGRRRGVRRRDPRVHHPGIRAQRDRARPRHHPRQHQPPGTRADHHRPQLPGEDQRQYRQLRRHLAVRRRKSRSWCGRSAGAPTR